MSGSQSSGVGAGATGIFGLRIWSGATLLGAVEG